MTAACYAFKSKQPYATVTPDRLYVLLGKLGDILSFLPALRQEAHVRGGQPVSLMVAKQYADVLDGCSYIKPVIFDGEMDDLDKAMEQAQQTGLTPMCVQVAGPKELIWKHTFTPAGLSEQTTDRFERLPWVVAGYGSIWKEQFRLIFDERNNEREEALWAPWRAKLKGRKPILLAVNSESSPFPFSKLLDRLLKLQFKGPFIDLSQIKAERFYDLLIFYEKALCLIAADSAPLHLAQACLELPVCTLINDKPSLGHGSAWRANHIRYIRYSDFPARATELLDAVESIRSGRRWLRQMDQVNRIHAYSCYEDGEDRAQNATLIHQEWITTPIEVGACGADSAVVLKDQKRMPFVKDVITLASYRAQLDDLIVLTRKDTEFYAGDFTRLCFAHREVILDGVASWHPAVDMFVFTKRWWREHSAEYPNFYLGHDPHWHRVLMELLKKHGARELTNAVYRSGPPLKFSYQSPYVLHNERLALAWLKENNITALFPSVTKQIASVQINRRAIFTDGYNPALVRYEGKLLMAYRYHPQNSASTKLAMAELDEDFNVTSNTEIPGIEGNSIEDPKLWVQNGQLCLSWVASSWPDKFASKVVYSRIAKDGDKWTLTLPEITKPYGTNDGTGTEKNWVPIVRGDDLYWLWMSQPRQVAFKACDDSVNVWEDGPRWKWGSIKGGAPPIEYDGKLLRFFHSTLDNEPAPYRRRYYVGAVLLSPEPPFAPVAISKEPIIRGSEDDSLTETERASCGHYKPKVVFPGGCVSVEGGWLLALGCNDSSCLIAKITSKDLRL